jgi:hypothetical protein
MENKILNEKLLPIDKRLTTGGISSFKTTSTPVTKSTIKSQIKIDSDEQTSSYLILLLFFFYLIK